MGHIILERVDMYRLIANFLANDAKIFSTGRQPREILATREFEEKLLEAAAIMRGASNFLTQMNQTVNSEFAKQEIRLG